MKILTLLAIFFLNSSLHASESFVIETDTPNSAVSLVKINAPESDQATQLGLAPVTISSDKIEGHTIRVEAPNKKPVNWLFLNKSKQLSTLKIGLSKKNLLEIDQQTGKPVTSLLNDSHSDIIAAYDALERSQFGLAKKLAEEVSKKFPRLASAKIIQGMVELKSNNRKKAREFFLFAKTLAPDDTEIDQLLKVME